MLIWEVIQLHNKGP